ncbi:MAG: tRNA pseudouridine(55) synthase TruB [Flavobacteriales bacterium]|nr:tRNA pseudouridine(55) synthase TruB [Flavobacteriales bacterium]
MLIPNTFSGAEDFKDGVLLIVDKPYEWTSFDVVNKLRYAIRKQFGWKKIKVGHAGTLDPLATGVLVICVGRATKQINELMAQEKEYTGTITLGATTPSYDLETEVDQTFPTDHITEEILEKARQSFLGTISQTPPIFSAKKIDGKRAYKAARAGQEVKMRSVEVDIQRFDLTRVELPEVDFDLKCSKGTYVRSIAFDFGQKLDSGAHLSTLRRTASGPFSIDQAKTVEELVGLIENV